MKSRVGIVALAVCVFIGTSVMGGMSVPQTSVEETAYQDTLEMTLDFPPPEMQDGGDYIHINLENDVRYLNQAGYPMIPYRPLVASFPLGTRIDEIHVETSPVNIMALPGKIQPSASPVVTTLTTETGGEVYEGEIYESGDPYPATWVTHHIGVGRDGNDPTVFVSLQVFPCKYLPLNEEIQWIDAVEITIEYTYQEPSLPIGDDYDLIVIAPSEFAPDLQPLIDHKNSYGVSTRLVTLDEIYGGTYFPVEGRDDPEKIKYFIKDALENWGITYVLLVGGRNGGLFQEKWWVPVRYSHLYDGSGPPVFYEYTYLCDLYFSDIYRYEEGAPLFDDWDSDQDGVFAEWRGFSTSKDILDMYPDVYVGRLPCRNTYEVKGVINKIITYETTAYGQTWSKMYVGVAGDTYPGSNDPFYEGELANAAAFGYLEGFEATQLWTSTGTFSEEQDVIDTISEGCGFLHFSGHGNPMGWANHPPRDEASISGLRVQSMYKLSNMDMYPVCLVGGCHNSQFNVSLLNLLKIYEGFEKWRDYIYWGSMSPECWSWWLVRKSDGGTIATLGNSGYGYGIQGENCLTGRGRFMEILFFKSYSEGRDILGETHGMGITEYMNVYPPMRNNIDCKIVQQWILIGDPSLKIGGYPS